MGSVLYTLAPLVGALVTIMSGVNSRFAGIVGNLVAILVIHGRGSLLSPWRSW